MSRYEIDNMNENFKVSIFEFNTNYPSNKVAHKHTHYEIMHVNSQDKDISTVEVGKTEYTFNSSSVLLFPPNVPHLVSRTKIGSTRYIISIRDNFIEPIANFADVDLKLLFSQHVLNYSSDKMNKIVELFTDINKEFKSSKSPESSPHLKILFAMLLHELTHYRERGNFKSVDNSQISKIVSFIKYNYFLEINLDMLAKQFGMSKYDICRKLKAEVGSTFGDLLKHTRINAAREYLEDTQMTIVEISKKVGFNNPNYFTKVFKETAGILPTEYRESKQEKNSKENKKSK